MFGGRELAHATPAQKVGGYPRKSSSHLGGLRV